MEKGKQKFGNINLI